jgi:HD superfamily phosphohydrolase
MPTWGLSPKQRELEPWEVHWTLLLPRKVTTDEVWGDIHTTVLEQALVDTTPVQRLRRVRQLGNSHLVYPGATHTRFSHSLGALKVVQDLLDAVIAQRDGIHPVKDLLSQWQQRDDNETFERRIAEVTVLGRLGALLHDLGHVPFGHSIEDDLGVLVSHDENAERFEEMWEQICDQLPGLVERHMSFEQDHHLEAAVDSIERALGEDGRLYENLRPLIISKDDQAKQRKREERDYPFVEDLVGDTICADLLDYLLRDHLNTGLPASLGWRFTAAFFAVPEGRGPLSKRAALNIMRDGHERTDVISELLKALRYRYELNERVLYHHAKLSADAMIGKGLELWADAVWLEDAGEQIARLDNAEDLVEAEDIAGLREAVRATATKQEWELFERARQLRLEQEFLAHGDDGLLERMERLQDEAAESRLIQPLVSNLNRQASVVATAVLKRELFTVAGRVGLADAPAHQLYDRYGAASDRVALQDQAQRFAELGRESKVLLWLPNPHMRLKLAKVLVDDGQHISEFNRFEDARGRRGDDIYRADRALWALWVFVRRDVAPSDRDAVLVYLADRLGVAWESLRDSYPSDTSTWLARWGLREVLEEPTPTAQRIESALRDVSEISHRGEVTTRSAYLADLRALPGIE